MMWRHTDPQHPGYDAALARSTEMRSKVLSAIDQVLGEVLPKLDQNTTLLVLSDHGFAPYGIRQSEYVVAE